MGAAVRLTGCINSQDACKTILEFCKHSGIPKDRMLSLILFLLSSVPEVNEPKVVADFSLDFDGIYDFQFILDDYTQVLKNKAPTSKPKRDSQRKSYVPEYKEVKSSYIFGLQYDPRTKLMKIRYKLYPQRSWWGFRYEEKYRTFDDLLEFIARDLIQYHKEDQSEVIVTDPEEESVPTSEEDLEDLEDDALDSTDFAEDC